MTHRSIRFIRLVLIVCLIPALTAVSRAADWPQWRCDAARTAASPDELPPALQLLWTRHYTPRDDVWDDPLNQDLMPYDRIFEPVAADGRVFLGFNDSDKLVALDANTGKELWAFYADGPVRLPPVASRGNVYFASDDGSLYCLNAADGTTKWRFRPVPSERKVLGNKRLISAWPARGGPVLRDRTVYFAAGIWPFMGTFICAIDADTGKPVWLNDSTGASFIPQPHMTPAFGGVAPQGALAATDRHLLVPGGRGAPAGLDRATGQLAYFRHAEWQRGYGGSFIAADDARFYVHTRRRGVAAADINNGRLVRLKIRLPNGKDTQAVFECTEPVITPEALYAAGDANVIALDRNRTVLWQVPADGSGDLIKAGTRLYAAGKKAIVAIDLPAAGRPAGPAWSLPVEGEILRLIAADRKLFAVTLDGRVMAFGEKKAPPNVLKDAPKDIQPEPAASAQAKALLKQSDADEGYALWFGVDDAALLDAVLANSRLHVVAVDPDPAKVGRLRRRYDEAGLYGSRVAVHVGDPATFQAPPCVASLIVVGRTLAPKYAEPATLARIYESLRPYGGALWLPIPDPPDTGKLAGARPAKTDGGTFIFRDGPLPGSAPWTHAYGDVANTVKSDDQRVKLPLGVLWFGGPSNLDVLPRHGHGPSPQIIGGRLFIEGIDSLSARDVYTGRLLWKIKIDNTATFGVYYDNTYRDAPLGLDYNQGHIPGANARGTNYIAANDAVYLVQADGCHVLDPRTGKTLRLIKLPGRRTWAYIGVYENILLAGGDYKNYGKTLPPKEAKQVGIFTNVLSSSSLVAFNRHTGDILWTVDAKSGFVHNGICAGGGRIYCLDRTPPSVLRILQRRGQPVPENFRIIALDPKTGKTLWENDRAVFGTWLSYSQKHDLLLQAGAASRDRGGDEIGQGMTVLRAKDGSVLWTNAALKYTGPCIIHRDWIITNVDPYQNSQGAYSLLDGSQITIDDPLTGQKTPWSYTRTYGCNTVVASEHLLTFRSGAAGYYDLARLGGTGNFGGFKSGCTSNLIVADGVLNAPDYTRTCSCSYQNQTSLALIPMPEAETWTYDVPPSLGPARLQRLGVNFGAPGDRRADDGTLWLEHPPATEDKGRRIGVEVAGTDLAYSRQHSARFAGPGLNWVAASCVQGITLLAIPLEATAPASADKFSVRWTARLRPDHSETYTIYATTDDGVRVWIGDTLIIDRWKNQPPAESQAALDLDAGKDYPLKVEYFENVGDASAKLEWSSPSTPRQVIPRERLTAPDGKPGLLGQYFANPTLAGAPAAARTDGAISFNWGLGSPEPLVSVAPALQPAGRTCTVRLHFAEPADLEPGQRVFTVSIQDREVLRDFDIVKEAGGPRRSLVKEFKGVPVADRLVVQFRPKTGQPLLSGIELIAE